MATSSSLQKAAQAWCTPTTSKKVMDPELAEAFAEIIENEKKMTKVKCPWESCTWETRGFCKKNAIRLEVVRIGNGKDKGVNWIVDCQDYTIDK